MHNKCLCCGKEFKVYPSEVDIRKYCSLDCKYKSLSEQRKNRIIVKCSNCGKEKEITPSKKNEHNFCNQKCMGEFYSKSKKSTYTCKQCGKEFSRVKNGAKSKNIFCSRECSAIYNGLNNRNRITIKCDCCNKNIIKRPCEISSGDRKFNFCNSKCRQKFMSEHMLGKNNPNWKGGHDEYRGPNWIRQRRAARERDNKSCVECGATGKDIKLVVHHIVPFRFFNNDHKTANKIRNLKTLCRSCHGKQESHLWNKVPKDYEYLLNPYGRR